MAFNPDEQLSIISTVAELSAHMIKTFKHWSDEDWNRDSFCEGWTRADVVAHVTTGTDYRAQVLKLGLADDPIFPWGARSLDEVRSIRARSVDELCGRGPEALLNGFITAVDEHQEVLASIQRADLAKVARYPRGLVPIGEWVGMQLIELIVHDWDMRQPHDASAQLALFAVEPVLNVLPESQMRFLTHRLADSSSLKLQDGEYQICLGEMAWAFHIENQEISYVGAPDSSSTMSFYSDPETLILLTLGRLDIDSQLATGNCRFEGNPDRNKTLVYDLLFRPYISASVIAPNV